MGNIFSLPIAVRVYPDLRNTKDHLRSEKSWKRPDAMLVWDTETRVDAAQRLTFGSYRFIVHNQCLEEGLFYADNLSGEERRILEEYTATNPADAVDKQLHLRTRREFMDIIYRAVYKGRCLCIGFNLPFDLSRASYDFKDARGRFAGGFSLGIWSYLDEMGHEQAHQYRPRIGIKHIDSKRALKGFTARNEPDWTDLIPEGSPTGKPEKGYKFRGHFLDLRTLAFALTDKSYSLESACHDFGVEHGKQRPTQHGIVTPEYIDYNRRDVLATSELAVKLLDEYDKHPIALQPTKAYSPASIGKAYLRAMGITPILERQPDFPKQYLGYAESAFIGGRTSAHVRKVAVPLVYTDFLSMYPTVNGLMDLWRFVIAKEIKVVEHCQDEIQGFLSRLSSAKLFKPATWKKLTGFVQIIPDGDILPTRAKYSQESNDWQVGVNYLYGDRNNALWFSLPDVVASVLLTGRIPKIVDAFRIVPTGILPGLSPLKLRGSIDVDPGSRDFFKVVIEERKGLSSRTDLSANEKRTLDKALKVLANATSYGIYAEMNRQESDHHVKVTCHGIDAEPFTCRVAHPDVPGEYCFPPMAALITGAARLMLALLENCVREKSGTYAMEDTDSMAIVATEKGGTILCDGKTITALSWAQVREISERFTQLNPYDRDAIPGSILKIEDDNFDLVTHEHRQIYCLAISAKRYSLFILDKNGNPILLRKGVNNNEDRWSEHGLGHLLNPTDPDSEDREWIAMTWENIIRRALKLPTEPLSFEKLPAVGRITVSSPAVIKPLREFNSGKAYAERIKPFNFLLTCQVMPFGHPPGTDPQHFHLIAPYEPDPRQWTKMEWIDQYSKSGKTYHITTVGHYGTRNTARVKTYGDVLQEYEYHPESKCADATGNPCSKQTVGLLERRHIKIEQTKYIGKESNALEDVASGLIHSEQSVYTEYPDPRRDEWQTKTLPLIKNAPLQKLVKMSRMSPSALKEIRAGRARPHRRNQDLLTNIAKELAKKNARPRTGGNTQCPTRIQKIREGGNENIGSSEMQGGECSA
jgi:hypothetical protein